MNRSNQRKRRYPFKKIMSRKFRKIIFMLVAAAVASGVNYFNNLEDATEQAQTEIKHSHFSSSQQISAINKIKNAQNNTNAQFWVGFNAKVIKNLKDDNTGSRHQKFLISPSPGLTLLVAHNIDLASRVPSTVGSQISLYGRYEWNNRGGVMHWTHHDPKGRKKGGWIQVNGKKYR